MGRVIVRRRRTAGLAAVAVVAMVGCNLGVDPVSYELFEEYGDPLGPSGLASGDVDSDGDVDVVVTGERGYGVLTNDGTGTFAYEPSFPYASPSSPSLVDMDGDDDLDVLSTIRWYEDPQPTLPGVNRNDGSGGFGTPEPVGPTTPPGGVSAVIPSDADGDGDVDVLAAMRIGLEHHVAVYLNDGSGGFGDPVAHPLGFPSDSSGPVRLVAGDVDDDGDDDVVATDVGDFTTPGGEVVDGTVAMVALNDGSGAFAPAAGPIEVSWTGAIWALHPALADLDGDGHLDIAVGGPMSVTTLLGDGTGAFAAPRRTEVPDQRDIEFVTPADVDGDGHVDLVAVEDTLNDPGSGLVLYGDGEGGVDRVQEIDTGTSGVPDRDVGIIDLELDGDPDLLFLANSLGVVENALDGTPAS